MMSNDVSGLMNQLNINTANVVGNSMGGRIALALAVNHPEKINKLILISTSARPITGRRLTWFGWARILPIVKSKYPQPRYAFQNQRDAVSSGDYFYRLKEIKIPTEVIHGAKDNVVPIAAGQELADNIPGAKFVTLTGGHFLPFLGERQLLADEIAKFLSAV